MNEYAKCTGMRCPMQHGYKVDECNHTNCPYRTAPMTNGDRIRAMSDEELAGWLTEFGVEIYTAGVIKVPALMTKEERFDWLKQPAEE